MCRTRVAVAALTAMIVCSVAASGQERPVQFGLTATGSIKYQFLPPNERNYHLLGEAGIGASARISGSTEGSLAFLPKVGLAWENIGYHETSDVKYFIETINLIVHPEILFPTRNEDLQIAVGIGVDWVLDTDLSMYSQNVYQSGGTLDAAYNVIVDSRRVVIPFISAGILYRIRGGLHLQAFLRQDMRNAFPAGTVVTFSDGVRHFDVTLSHQPTRLGGGVVFLF